MKKRLVDSLPIKKYQFTLADCLQQFEVGQELQGDANHPVFPLYIRIDDLEEILQKLTNPKVITKVVKHLTFGGGDLDLEKILKDL